MRFERRVELAGGPVGLLEDNVRGRKPPGDVASFVYRGRARAMGALVGRRRILLQRVLFDDDVGLKVVFDLDGANRVPCLIRRFGRHRSNLVAFVAAVRIEQLAQWTVARPIPRDVTSRRGGGDHRPYARHLLGRARVDLLHDGVRVRTAQDCAVQHIGQHHVGRKHRRSAHALVRVDARNRLADHARLAPRRRLFRRLRRFRQRTVGIVEIVVSHGPSPFPKFSRTPDGLEDVAVGSATTEISAHAFADLSDRRVRRGPQQSFCSHHLSGRAVPALQRVLLDEGLLHGPELLAAHQAFHRRDFNTLSLECQRHAGIAGNARDQDRAAAAFAALASRFAAGELQLLANHVEERPARLDEQSMTAAVDRQRQRRHILGTDWFGRLVCFDVDERRSAERAGADRLDEAATADPRSTVDVLVVTFFGHADLSLGDEVEIFEGILASGNVSKPNATAPVEWIPLKSEVRRISTFELPVFRQGAIQCRCTASRLVRSARGL